MNHVFLQLIYGYSKRLEDSLLPDQSPTGMAGPPGGVEDLENYSEDQLYVDTIIGILNRLRPHLGKKTKGADS